MDTTTPHDTPQKSGNAGCFTMLGIFVLLVIGAIVLWPKKIPVHLPATKLMDEPLFVLFPNLPPDLGAVYLTNTFVATVIAYVLILIGAFVVGRRVRQALANEEYVLGGFSGAMVMLLEGIYNMTEATAGKWARTIFPYFATIMMLVLVVNWMELLPGVETIGLLTPVTEEVHYGYEIEPLAGGVYALASDPIKIHHGEEKAGGHGEANAHGTDEGQHALYDFRPLVRVSSTDLNFTLALALVSVVMTQVIGFRALGLGYLTKFFNFKALFTKPGMGLLDFVVGLLELISEFSKILSFSFRLFGNIFAGSVLLFVMGALAPFILPGFYGLELFVGLIQAFVFGMLTMVFMAQATHSHSDH